MQQHGVALDFSADPIGIHFPIVAQPVFQTDTNILWYSLRLVLTRRTQTQMTWT